MMYNELVSRETVWNWIYFIAIFCYCGKNLPFALCAGELIFAASLNLKAYFFEKVAIIIHETKWAIQNSAEKILKLFWMAKPVFVAKSLDKFWIGMKVLSNLV